MGSEAVEGASSPTAEAPDARLVWILAAVGFVAGLLVAPLVCHRYDVRVCFLPWSRASLGSRPWLVYPAGCDYPPLIPYLLTLGERVRLAAGAEEEGALAVLLVKLPGLLAYLGAVALCRIGLRRPFGEAAARRAALAAALALPLLVNAALWGQFDGFTAVLVAGAVVAALHDRPWTTGAMLGLAVGSKLLAVVAAPALALWLWRRLGPGSVVRAGGAGLAVLVLLSLPYTLAGHGADLAASYTKAVDFYPRRTVEAYNVWYLLDRFDIAVRHLPPAEARLDAREALGPLTFRGVGLLAFAGFLAFVLAGAARRPRPDVLVLATGLGFFAFFMLPTQVHGRYSLAAVPVLALAAGRSRTAFLLFVALAVTSTANQGIDLARSLMEQAARADAEILGRAPVYRALARNAATVVATANVALLAWATVAYWRETFGASAPSA